MSIKMKTWVCKSCADPCTVTVREDDGSPRGCVYGLNSPKYNWEVYEIPQYETVQQWEARTGEKYPDDGPVWHNAMICGLKTLIISRYGFYKERGIDNYVVVATHHGKPPADVQGGE